MYVFYWIVFFMSHIQYNNLNDVFVQVLNDVIVQVTQG